MNSKLLHRNYFQSIDLKFRIKSLKKKLRLKGKSPVYLIFYVEIRALSMPHRTQRSTHLRFIITEMIGQSAVFFKIYISYMYIYFGLFMYKKDILLDSTHDVYFDVIVRGLLFISIYRFGDHIQLKRLLWATGFSIWRFQVSFWK